MATSQLFEFDRVQGIQDTVFPEFGLLSLRNLALDWNNSETKVKPFDRDDAGYVVASRYVGRFSYDNKAFEIIPRIGWKRFGLMLDEVVSVALGGSGIYHSESAGLSQGDILPLIWCITLLNAWRQSGSSAPRVFETLSAVDRTSLRGRFDVAAQIRFNLVNKHHLACTWDEAITDNPINQGILVVIDHLRRNRRFPFQNRDHEQVTDFQRQLMEINSNLMNANTTILSSFPIGSVKWSRGNDRFKVIHRLGKILVEQGRATGPLGDNHQSFLLDSAEIWEMFLFHRLKRALAEEHPNLVLSWPRDDADDRHHMVEWEGKSGQLLIPDMIIKCDGKCIAIIDAKYRHFKTPIEDRELASQMALYASSYGEDEPLPVMVLVYPSVTKTKKNEDQRINPKQDCTKSGIGNGFLNFNKKKIPLIAWAIDLNCKDENPPDFNNKIDKEVKKLVERILP